MNDKELLETIKDQFEWGEENLESGIYNLESEEIKWLIEQAEKVEQLEQEIERLKSLVMYAEEKGLLKKKICSYCNSIYWARHGNSRYCPNCDRRTVWSRKKSKRTLEEIE
ncbi:hypothetical protein [Geobacillus thermodenitrificans]|jgi:ssDNA-binding Zn-finger/Zn-ribbon topoisomerase 1|uniref:hypothetical protein n=1 Tax=Geobacillus thermodenitrificans TaxID=33940 RepID=UPI0004240F91|nr:hypothetical protein [Geobacillus thermodenitrificans]ARA98603.1 hypothetical protein GD3902_11515 [Geobacillus thermodenitrificans]